MTKYLVTYYECYSRGYEVEANSQEEAEEIVKNDIYEGRREAPDNCYDSGCQTKEIGADGKPIKHERYFAVHMVNRNNYESRIEKIKAENVDQATDKSHCGYGTNWTWTGSESWHNVEGTVELIERNFYRKK